MAVDTTASATATTAQPCNEKLVIRDTKAILIFMNKLS
jgi:hypothetical protein